MNVYMYVCMGMHGYHSICTSFCVSFCVCMIDCFCVCLPATTQKNNPLVSCQLTRNLSLVRWCCVCAPTKESPRTTMQGIGNAIPCRTYFNIRRFPLLFCRKTLNLFIRAQCCAVSCSSWVFSWHRGCSSCRSIRVSEPVDEFREFVVRL